MDITSPDNPLVRRLARLDDPAGRRDEGLFLAEGLRLIDGLIVAGWRPAHLLVRDGVEVPATWPVATRVSERIMRRLSGASSASGYLAAFAPRAPPALDPAAGGLVLAGVSDPGNTGALLRSAAAFGIRQVILAGGADPHGPKVVQATAGALALLDLHRHAGPAALAGGAPLCALVVHGGMAPRELVPGPRWLVVGGEANGVPPDWLAACGELLTLPMPGGTESLNAAIAGSIAAYLLRVDHA